MESYGQNHIYLLCVRYIILCIFVLVEGWQMKESSVSMAGPGSTKVTINDTSKYDDGVRLIWSMNKLSCLFDAFIAMLQRPMLMDQGEQREPVRVEEYHSGQKLLFRFWCVRVQ